MFGAFFFDTTATRDSDRQLPVGRSSLKLATARYNHLLSRRHQLGTHQAGF
jgi:hypothetical protein